MQSWERWFGLMTLSYMKIKKIDLTDKSWENFKDASVAYYSSSLLRIVVRIKNLLRET